MMPDAHVVRRKSCSLGGKINIPVGGNGAEGKRAEDLPLMEGIV